MDKNSKIKLRSGNSMPIMGLGTWQLNQDTAGTVAHAVEIGYRMIDTSGDYGTHSGIREAIKKMDLDRGDLYVVTKIEEDDDAYEAAKKYITDELGLEYADLVLIHRPPPRGAGKDLWRGLIQAKEEGFMRDIGVSNYSIDLIDELAEITGEVPAVNQIEWSPFGYSGDMLAYCREMNIVIQAYSPLTRTRRLDDPVVGEIAGKYNKTPAQVLIRWNLQLGTVPLPKANKKEHQEENIEVFDFELSDEDMRNLNTLNEEYSVLGGLAYL